ncbi:hypothetical protein [Nocardioides sp. TF02-7]|uniref:hypothetical protein n=1 Tax=Nocardioides sp. TF02-7 TaxID=2917724 RepID=UPI001F061D76|nr:hypothetical protein [Nocardioides sp. TF02-7]UMG91545.1 hypothetical protein MF408_15710 [Nocardioides sp. TF02-7]
MHTGSARVYAGEPDGAHRLVASVPAGGTTTLPAIAAGEVFSVQSDDPFTYALATTPVPDPDPDPDPDPGAPRSSASVTWDCTGSPCPWGAQTTGHAAVWPAQLEPVRNRYGYTTSAGVYAPGAKVSGYQVTVGSGTANVYAGDPNGSHRLVASIPTGSTTTLPAVAAGEVFSVQSDDPFTYTLTPGTPLPPLDPPCQDPVACDPVAWTPAIWVCNIPGCTDGDWVGGVVSWPPGTAYSSNGRSGGNSRTVYAEDGSLLHPYMGPWADGCEVTVLTGEVLVIEWERGEDVWRETVVGPGETHTIELVGAENGAMLETPNNSEPFTVSLASCTPEPVGAG